MTRSSAGHSRWTDEMLDELADSVSGVKDSVLELRESVSEVKDSVEGLQLTAQALLQIAAQQQRENEARQAEIAEIFTGNVPKERKILCFHSGIDVCYAKRCTSSGS